jgi:hypothetical protein
VNKESNGIGYPENCAGKPRFLIQEERIEMKMERVVVAFLFTLFVCGAPPLAKAQSSSGSSTSSSTSQSSVTTHAQPGQTYQKPTGGEKVRNYLFDAFGPYALIGSALAAGINQASGDKINGHGSGIPPEWGGGVGP